MPRNILECLSPDLAQIVERATGCEQRRLCAPICKLAIERTDLNEPLISNAVNSLEKGALSDKALTAELQNLVDTLDLAYFAAQERYEEGKGDKEAFVALFRKARAAEAVLGAFKDDAFLAASSSIYEASSALDDVAEVEDLVKSLLRQQS